MLRILNIPLQRFLALLLCGQLIFPVTLFARIVELTEARNLRDVEGQTDPNAPLGLVGRLSAGSQIEIPDQYCVFKNGKFDFDASVKLWMKDLQDKQGKKPVLAKFNATQKDYFIPITVTTAAAGSKVKDNGKLSSAIPKDKTFYISIRNVVVDDKSGLTTSNATALYAKSKATQNSKLEAEGCEQCQAQKSSPIADVNKHLQNDVATKAKAPKQVSSSNLITSAKATQILNHYSTVSDQMKKTCGFGLDQFIPEMAKQTENTPFTVSELMSIMNRESTGNCFPKSKAIRDSLEHGLFGITDKVGDNEGYCRGVDQRNGITNAAQSSDAFATFSHYATNPNVNCVGNPILNLHAAIRVLSEKLRDYQRRNPRAGVVVDGKLNEAGFKIVSELYAGQGQKSYAKAAESDAVNLQYVFNQAANMNNP